FNGRSTTPVTVLIRVTLVKRVILDADVASEIENCRFIGSAGQAMRFLHLITAPSRRAETATFFNPGYVGYGGVIRNILHYFPTTKTANVPGFTLRWGRLPGSVAGVS